MAAIPARPQIIAHEVDRPRRGWVSWLTTTDHKKIGILYLSTVLVFFVIGGVEALLLRLQLGTPENTLLTPEKYNQVLTMHGTTMIFLVIVPVWAGFANYFLPLMIGARDVAFPRLNAWSYWMFLFGGLALYGSLFFTPPEAGWFSYVPLSLKKYTPSNGQEAWIYMVHLTGLASIIGAINFIATIHNMRAAGMGWGRMPLFVWTILIYSYLIILALTSLAATVTMLLLDRVGGIFTFLMGGITGIFLAVFPVDWQLTDTYFVVAHFHYTAFGASAFAMLAALYYWFPKMTGRMLSEPMGKVGFWLFFIGFQLTFLIQHSMGLDGMPRRIYEYSADAGWTWMNRISTVGAFVIALGVLLTIINVARSIRRGTIAGPDPWKANTLEWFTTSPPPENNFDVIPRVRSVTPMQDIRREVAAAQGKQVGSVAQPL